MPGSDPLFLIKREVTNGLDIKNYINNDYFS